MKQINIAANTQDHLPLTDLVEFQGELKSLSKENYGRLAASIERDGFIAAIHVWRSPEDGRNYVLDGHQRLRTVRQMVASNAYTCPVLPVVYVNADSRLEAKKKLLAMASQFGRVEPQGLYEFMTDIDMDTSQLFANYHFPEIDADAFKAEFFGEHDPYGADGDAAGNLVKNYSAPPFTVLDTRQGYWKDSRNKIVDLLKLRSHLGRKEDLTFNQSINRGQATTSIFDAFLCQLIVQWWSPKEGMLLDPFAGGSVRGIVAGWLGRHYVGIDLRAEQIAENNEQLANVTEQVTGNCVWLQGDSARELDNIGDASMDLVFSCPPYLWLEKYCDDPDDLSNMDENGFYGLYRTIIHKSVAKLKQDRFACFVVADIRRPDGGYVNFVGQTVKFFEEAGCKFYNEAILVNSYGSAALRANRNFKTRKLVKVHQNVLVFVKGDPIRAAEACAAGVEITWDQSLVDDGTSETGDLPALEE